MNDVGPNEIVEERLYILSSHMRHADVRILLGLQVAVQ
jgi:hypothetical protein